MNSLSVIIICKNEEEMLEDCLKSVLWADEIIIVDSGSNDQTLNIARKYTDKVYTHTDWQGFGIQKNIALSYASKSWVLSIDADERVPQALQEEIINILQSPANTVFEIPRRSWFLGKEIHHSGWSPDYVARLFRRNQAKFSNDLVHERLLFDHAASRCKQSLIHYSFSNLDQVIHKMNFYSTAGAENKFNAHKKGGLGKALLHGFSSFFKTYIIKLGLLDGREGFILALANAQGSYYRYLKLYYMEHK